MALIIFVFARRQESQALKASLCLPASKYYYEDCKAGILHQLYLFIKIISALIPPNKSRISTWASIFVNRMQFGLWYISPKSVGAPACVEATTCMCRIMSPLPPLKLRWLFKADFQGYSVCWLAQSALLKRRKEVIPLLEPFDDYASFNILFSALFGFFVQCFILL